METKTGEISIKNLGEGKATVVIATLGIKDRDGDVLLPGAFGEQIVPVVGAHEWRSVPIAKARIYEINNKEALADIIFNTETSLGKDWYSAIKFDFDNPPPKQEYSWGFTVGPQNFEHGLQNGQKVRFLKADDSGNPIKIHEVSPVLVASGHNTRSLSVKEDMGTNNDSSVEERREQVEKSRSAPNLLVAKDAWHVVGIHHEATDDSPFEAIRHYKRLKSSQAAGLYRSAFALQWPGTQAEMKESWGFLHHVIDDEGKPGAASLHACLIGISLLKGWEGLFVPEDVRERLHAHYAAHLQDGGYDVPQLMKRDSGIEMKHELKFWLWQAKSVLDRRERIKEFLIRTGRDESKEMVEQFDQLYRYVTHMHHVGGSAGEAMDHIAEQEELTRKAEQISRELDNDALREEEAKQAELKELFERFRANHG